MKKFLRSPKMVKHCVPTTQLLQGRVPRVWKTVVWIGIEVLKRLFRNHEGTDRAGRE